MKDLQELHQNEELNMINNPMLDTVIVHKNWYVKYNEDTKKYEPDGTTKRKALWYFAYSTDFIKNETKTGTILNYRGKERGQYRLNKIELRYFDFLAAVRKEYQRVYDKLCAEGKKQRWNEKLYYIDHQKADYKDYLAVVEYINNNYLEGCYYTETYKQLLHCAEYLNSSLIEYIKEKNLISEFHNTELHHN